MRESVTLNEAAIRVYSKNKEIYIVPKAVVLSTCNPTEIYYTTEVSLKKELIKLLAIHKGFIGENTAAQVLLLDMGLARK